MKFHVLPHYFLKYVIKIKSLLKKNKKEFFQISSAEYVWIFRGMKIKIYVLWALKADLKTLS